MRKQIQTHLLPAISLLLEDTNHISLNDKRQILLVSHRKLRILRFIPLGCESFSLIPI